MESLTIVWNQPRFSAFIASSVLLSYSGRNFIQACIPAYAKKPSHPAYSWLVSLFFPCII
jgi:hypothetical protein